MKKVLVVAAHADDEALGCGGTIARHVAEGDEVHLVLMADGVSSRPGRSELELNRRIDASGVAQAELGIATVERADFPDNKMDGVPLLAVVQRLETVLEKIKPSVIYTHHHGDLNIDHRLTHAAVMTACRPLPETSVREILGFEALSSTEWVASRELSFAPNYFVDISRFLAIKLRALGAYSDEMRQAPHSRSFEHIEVLARHRGYSIGVGAAEAFEIYRMVR